MAHPELAARAVRHWNLPQEIGSVLGSMDDLACATPELRPLALTLIVALAASDQLTAEQEAERAFEPPAVLPTLAACTDTAPEALVALVEERRERVRQFIAAMSA